MSFQEGQEAIIAGAVAGHSLQRIAASANVSVSTVQRRLKVPDIADAIRDAKSQQRRELLGALASTSMAGAARLQELVDHPDPNVAIRAITVVLGSATRLATVVDIEERLARLEGASTPQDASDSTGRQDDHDDV